MSNSFIAVEGPHDVEFVAGLLEAEGFEKKVTLSQFDATFCPRLINTRFPHDDDLHKRVPNPMFLCRDGVWIAVQAAGGEAPKLAQLVEKVLRNLRPFPGSLAAIGVVRDADDKSSKSQLDDLLKELGPVKSITGYDLAFPENPGQITSGSPKFGVYVLPDNVNLGTLDDLLLSCGELVYPNLISGAQTFVNSVDRTQLTKDDQRLILKPSGPKKAVVGCAANILKPGMSIAPSIDQNRWLNEDTRKLPQVQSLAQFLKDLCGIA